MDIIFNFFRVLAFVGHTVKYLSKLSPPPHFRLKVVYKMGAYDQESTISLKYQLPVNSFPALHS